MPGRFQLVGNSISVVLGRLTQSIASFITTAAIARLLGAQELGQYLIGFTYYFLFMTVVAQGFKSLFIRDLSRNLHDVSRYLISGTVLQFMFSLIGYGLLVLVVSLSPYSSNTLTVCYLIGGAIIPFSLSNVTEAIFQAQERMHLLTISTVPVYILRVGVMVWAMTHGRGVNAVAVIFVISESLILLIEWGLMLTSVKPEWRVDWNFIWQTAKAARTFLAIEAIAIINSRRQILILSFFGGEVLVGLFGAIAQFMMPFDILLQSLILAVFPRLSKVVPSDVTRKRQLTERLAEISLCLALPYAIGLFFIGKDLLFFVYRNASFSEAGTALGLLSLSLITTSLSKPLSQTLIASGFERINLREVLVDTIVGSLITVLLVLKYQLLGAAIAPLFTNLIALGQFSYSVYVRLFSLNWWQMLCRPILLAGFMLPLFIFLQKTNQSLLSTVIISMLAYVLVGGVMGMYALGGPVSVWDRLVAKGRST